MPDFGGDGSGTCTTCGVPISGESKFDFEFGVCAFKKSLIRLSSFRSFVGSGWTGVSSYAWTLGFSSDDCLTGTNACSFAGLVSSSYLGEPLSSP